MENRKQRRLEAKKNKTTFKPQYNGEVITKAEYDNRTAELKAKRKEAEEKFKKSQEVTEEV